MKQLSALFLLLFISSSCFSLSTGGVDFSIRFHEKRIYYLGDKAHPVNIETVITNNSTETYRFKMANNRVFNLDFEVTTPTNIMLNHSKEFTIAKHSNQPILFREISLEPGEKYGIVISLADYVEIEKPGLYTVRALFHPELDLGGKALSTRGKRLISNSLTLNIRPAVVFPEERALIEAETGMLLTRKSLPPDEVVAYTLKARQKSQWEKFFLYLDLESLYVKKPERATRFKRLSEENRITALERFKNELKQERVDRDILIIPSSFKIVHTSYNPFEATVLVTARFDYRDYTEVKRYTYTLLRKDKVWIITDYSITNLGTE